MNEYNGSALAADVRALAIKYDEMAIALQRELDAHNRTSQARVAHESDPRQETQTHQAAFAELRRASESTCAHLKEAAETIQALGAAASALGRSFAAERAAHANTREQLTVATERCESFEAQYNAKEAARRNFHDALDAERDAHAETKKQLEQMRDLYRGEVLRVASMEETSRETERRHTAILFELRSRVKELENAKAQAQKEPPIASEAPLLVLGQVLATSLALLDKYRAEQEPLRRRAKDLESEIASHRSALKGAEAALQDDRAARMVAEEAWRQTQAKAAAVPSPPPSPDTLTEKETP